MTAGSRAWVMAMRDALRFAALTGRRTRVRHYRFTNNWATKNGYHYGYYVVYADEQDEPVTSPLANSRRVQR